MVNVDDLQEILGKRPYTTVESRNIDKFRDGFDKVAQEVEPETSPSSMGGPADTSGGHNQRSMVYKSHVTP